MGSEIRELLNLCLPITPWYPASRFINSDVASGNSTRKNASVF